MAVKKIVNFILAQDFLSSIGGKDAVALVKICEKKNQPVTDEEIETHLKVKITEIRTALNRLHYRGIAVYQKKRNNKTGWYSYTWEIKTKRIAALILEQQLEAIAKLDKRIEYEATYAFFICKKKCSTFPFEIATEYQFRCPECGTTMATMDNKKNLKDLKKQKETLETELEELKKMAI